MKMPSTASPNSSIYRALVDESTLNVLAENIAGLRVNPPEDGKKEYIGNFELGSPLGCQGGTSVTYLARAICNDPFGQDGDSSRPRYTKNGVYVIKTVKDSPKALLAFINELLIFSLLKDPASHNIATLVDRNDNPSKDPLYMIMDKIPFPALHDDPWFRGYDASRIVEIVEGIVKALVYLHRNNIVHGDIKPDNIRIDKEQKPLILDLGSAFSLDHAVQNEIIRRHGTYYYAPPEYHQYLLGEREDNPKGFQYDMFSLGVLVYALLTGDQPFSEFVGRGDALLDVIRYHSRGVSPFRKDLLTAEKYPSNQQADVRFLMHFIERATAPYDKRMTALEAQIEVKDHLERTGVARERRASSRLVKMDKPKEPTQGLSSDQMRQELAKLEAKENAVREIHAAGSKSKKGSTADTVTDLELK